MIYVIRNEESGDIKIGFADDPRKRLSHLQTGNHSELRILGVLPGGQAEERRLHERFSSQRLRGEWFRPDDAMLAALTKLVLPKPGVRHRLVPPCLYSESNPDIFVTRDRWKAARDLVLGISSNATPFVAGFAWGLEPFMTGSTSRRYSYQVMPEMGLGDATGGFWVWCLVHCEQWHESPGVALSYFLACFEWWRDHAPGAST